MTPVLWHNPRCTKSRETLALLRQKGVEPDIREYLKDVPDAEALKAVIKALGLDSVRGLMRTKEAAYKAQDLQSVTDDDALIAAMIAEPKLIERPVLITDKGAALGRPPEQVLDVL